MSYYRHILIATDLSVDTEALLDRANRLMSKTTKLSMLHAVRPMETTYFGTMPYVPVIIDGEEIENRVVEAKKEHFEKIIQEHELANTEWRLEIGKPSTMIKEYAEE
ncbi:MAG: universal stress protein, partial [Gammaproteobacteria bacterium]|nr:universal stress protein [Gammaproteobacteria bacterium]